MIDFIQTNAKDLDFQNLVVLLDQDLKIRDGEIHQFYAQFNKVDFIKNVIVAYADKKSIGCGAIKEFDHQTMEIKRMFVKGSHRNQGIAAQILTQLENWTKSLGYQKCILETGNNQPEAIRLYQKCNYQIIPNYGQYAGLETSFCFEKKL
ncbi:MAG: GNAT family N-acetyltransferase [Bacteroidetes bacterium]|nr:GNAT family N-acetyltransferase [Bacteroidota bacterium]MBU1371749.1 GNAT family N-acetyltransferase [Bacteroidota bacterium]MBU1483754.1 GNAT family N-acetyltransferase [Bacteroidota bacterium]MBU1760476.1 GNAT family N-acetyltransferase [Bacteroidota bacterium]MBU2268097.1 GNAT family N-acetyltransferase [Bacteroidota bacterium]